MTKQTDEARREFFARFPGAEEWINDMRRVFGDDTKITYLENMATGDRVGKTIEERGMVAVTASVTEKVKARHEQEREQAKARPKRKVQSRYAGE